LGNEGLSQSQRDHKRKANRRISFYYLTLTETSFCSEKITGKTEKLQQNQCTTPFSL